MKTFISLRRLWNRYGYNMLSDSPILVQLSNKLLYRIKGAVLVNTANFNVADEDIQSSNYAIVLNLEDEVQQTISDILNDYTLLTGENEQLKERVRKQFKATQCAINDLESRDELIRELNESLGELDIELQGLQENNRELDNKVERYKGVVKHLDTQVSYLRGKVSEVREALSHYMNGAVTCSCCGSPMLLRTNRETGGKFWGCSNYPMCDHTRNYGIRI
jgi:archaellum component FlaC